MTNEPTKRIKVTEAELKQARQASDNDLYRKADTQFFGAMRILVWVPEVDEWIIVFRVASHPHMWLCSHSGGVQKCEGWEYWKPLPGKLLDIALPEKLDYLTKLNYNGTLKMREGEYDKPAGQIGEFEKPLGWKI